MHVQIWIGLMVEVKTVHAENGQDGNCVCRELQVEETWVRLILEERDWWQKVRGRAVVTNSTVLVLCRMHGVITGLGCSK